MTHTSSVLNAVVVASIFAVLCDAHLHQRSSLPHTTHDLKHASINITDYFCQRFNALTAKGQPNGGLNFKLTANQYDESGNVNATISFSLCQNFTQFQDYDCQGYAACGYLVSNGTKKKIQNYTHVSYPWFSTSPWSSEYYYGYEYRLEGSVLPSIQLQILCNPNGSYANPLITRSSSDLAHVSIVMSTSLACPSNTCRGVSKGKCTGRSFGGGHFRCDWCESSVLPSHLSDCYSPVEANNLPTSMFKCGGLSRCEDAADARSCNRCAVEHKSDYYWCIGRFYSPGPAWTGACVNSTVAEAYNAIGFNAQCKPITGVVEHEEEPRV